MKAQLIEKIGAYSKRIKTDLFWSSLQLEQLEPEAAWDQEVELAWFFLNHVLLKFH